MVVNRENCRAAIRGSQVGLFAALVLTCADRLEQRLLGRPQIYAPRAIARRLYEVRMRSFVKSARQAGIHGLVLRAGYSAGLGALYGTLRERFPRAPMAAGIAFGTEIWAFELLAMPGTGAVPPLWKWPRAEIALLLAHALAFGITAALAYDRFVANPPRDQSYARRR
jgi:uncharacterized membrane protein YagU involved in acid resistance